jgi:hypothetical protein
LAQTDVSVMEVWRSEAIGDCESCLPLAPAIPKGRRIDRDADGLCPLGFDPRDYVAIEPAITLPVQKEPNLCSAGGCAFRYRGVRSRSYDNDCSGRCSASRGGYFTFRVHHALISNGGKQNWMRVPLTEKGDAGINCRDVTQHPGPEFDPVVSSRVVLHRDFVSGGSGKKFVHGVW